MGDFKEKKIQAGFPTLWCFTRSGVRTICDLVETVPSLVGLCSKFQLVWVNSCPRVFITKSKVAGQTLSIDLLGSLGWIVAGDRPSHFIRESYDGGKHHVKHVPGMIAEGGIHKLRLQTHSRYQEEILEFFF